jgi:hypothetical protein
VVAEDPGKPNIRMNGEVRKEAESDYQQRSKNVRLGENPHAKFTSLICGLETSIAQLERLIH